MRSETGDERLENLCDVGCCLLPGSRTSTCTVPVIRAAAETASATPIIILTRPDCTESVSRKHPQSKICFGGCAPRPRFTFGLALSLLQAHTYPCYVSRKCTHSLWHAHGGQDCCCCDAYTPSATATGIVSTHCPRSPGKEIGFM